MTIQWFPLITLLVVNFGLDLWLFRKFRRDKKWPRLKSGAHAVLSLVLLAMMVVAISIPRRTCDNNTFVAIMWMLYLYYAFYVPRYLAALVWMPTHLKKSGERTRKIGSIAATVLGVLVFIFMLSGLFVTPYQVNVVRVEMEFENLPQEFDGYRIVQFSDIHLGTYNGGKTEFIQECVDSINALKPDMICFTGDLVNRRTDEALPYKKILSTLHAPDGVVSILGNHDEARYFDWPTKKDALADCQALINLEREMGWKVLINENFILKRDSSEIAVVGTKSFLGWPFPRWANLDTAYVDYDRSDRFVLLLQHAPKQWKLDWAYQDRITMVRLCDKADLMLAGHTHAMQCMFTLFGRKFSPAWFADEFWGGLYTEGDHKLYINIGVGMVGMPARLGTACPEITLITLKKRGECVADANGKRIRD
ncbi:MAG: metallophosphoesterase [Muribaculaceae bacterium]|nr:metallophosphoesterase [Muribaculaceae bacterium]